MCDRVLNGLSLVDFFGKSVTLTYNGRKTFKSVCGGIVTILVVLGVVLQSFVTLSNLVKQPVYDQFPTTFDYD